MKATFLELPVFEGVVPLASGYMEAYCRKDPSIASAFEFEKLSMSVNTPFRDILSSLERSDANVYAFGCYVWNSGLVRRLLSALLSAKPQSTFVLGGPQVMHQASRYVVPEQDNVLVCNGEGERTFANILRNLLLPEPDWKTVRGVSFYRDGTLITTEPEPRIADLSEIPSPFLEGIFDHQKYPWMLLETNRGCPFKCNYCFWGAATGAKVFKYDDARVERELEWITRSGCLYLFIADANWGMLKRDVDLSKHLIDCQKTTGRPMVVYFCSSKNTPERVAEISHLFNAAGLIAHQSVALQTMSEEALKRVNRLNIKTSAYTEMQTTLNREEISSFIEMIWPLPGETLDSFEEGIGRLCDLGADSFFVYPLLLMNNVELNQKRQEYGLVTVRDPDPNSEADLVVQTADVSADAYRDGIRYVYAVTGLYSLRGLWTLSRYLADTYAIAYAALFRRFAESTRLMVDHPWTQFCEDSIRTLKHVQFKIGALIHQVLHEDRETFDELLEQFVTAQDFWRDPAARFFFEVDLINRPYIYLDTPIVPKRHRFECLRHVEATPAGYVVDVPREYRSALRRYLSLSESGAETDRFEVNHRRSQLRLMRHRSFREQVVYCQDVAHRMRKLVPIWQEVGSLEVPPQREVLRASSPPRHP